MTGDHAVIVRQRGGDALGLMSAMLFTLTLLNYLWFQQKNPPQTPIPWMSLILGLSPLWLTSVFYFILFLRFSKYPKQSARQGTGLWLLFSLFYLGTLFFSDQPLSSIQFFQYVVLCGLGFFFLYSTHLQAVRFEQRHST